MGGLFRKLFRIGKLPADMRAGVDSVGVIDLATCGCSRTLAFDVPLKFVYSVLGIPRG